MVEKNYPINSVYLFRVDYKQDDLVNNYYIRFLSKKTGQFIDKVRTPIHKPLGIKLSTSQYFTPHYKGSDVDKICVGYLDFAPVVRNNKLNRICG